MTDSGDSGEGGGDELPCATEGEGGEEVGLSPITRPHYAAYLCVLLGGNSPMPRTQTLGHMPALAAICLKLPKEVPGVLEINVLR